MSPVQEGRDVKTTTIKQMQMQVWQLNAERSRLAAELKAAGIARDMIRAHVVRLTNVVQAAATFAAAQSPLAQGDFAGDKFHELERALTDLVNQQAQGART